MNKPSDPQFDSLRVPPHSIESEQSVLGGLLLDNAAWDRIADFINADDFYRYDHRLIFQTIVKLITASRPADVITVFEALNSLGKADEVGGLSYLNALAQNTPSAANIRVENRSLVVQSQATHDHRTDHQTTSTTVSKRSRGEVKAGTTQLKQCLHRGRGPAVPVRE